MHGLVESYYLELGKYLLGFQHHLVVALMIEAGVEHCVVGVKLGGLFEHAYFDVASEDDTARIPTLLAAQHREQCRFARAVFGDESNALTFSYRETNVVEEHERPEGFCEVLNIEHRGEFSHFLAALC